MDKMAVWRERLAAWRASDVSAAAFCRARGLAYSQFVYWQRKLDGQGTGLVPVRVDGRALLQAALALELVLPGGVPLRVSGASAADVVALVRGLSC